MKTGLSKVTHFAGLGMNSNVQGGTTDTNFSKRSGHPYLRREFWANPNNQFWNSDLYSEASKEQLSNSINL